MQPPRPRILSVPHHRPRSTLPAPVQRASRGGSASKLEMLMHEVADPRARSRTGALPAAPHAAARWPAKARTVVCVWRNSLARAMPTILARRDSIAKPRNTAGVRSGKGAWLEGMEAHNG